MAHGARHFPKLGFLSSFAERHRGHATLVLAATAWSFAWLLWAVFSSLHNQQSVLLPAPLPANSNAYFSFLDTRFKSYFSPETFSESFTIRSSQHQISVASSAPVELNSAITTGGTSSLPQGLASLPRPNPLRVAQPGAAGTAKQSDEASAPEAGSKTTIFGDLFAKIFGKPSPVRLAYATADDGQLGGAELVTSRYDQWTAVYDISGHTVYMPDGTKLEAHSGFGTSLDDPGAVSVRDRGPTPPNIYSLALREKPFHGVRAIRLIPVDNEKALGRTGLLAHRFMMGPNGDSNGCLSVKDYDAFLQAYMSHQIKHLVVVARLD
jgi:hypothetical protein